MPDSMEIIPATPSRWARFLGTLSPSVRQALTVQRTFLPFTPEQLHAMASGSVALTSSYYPQMTLGKNSESLAAGFEGLATGAYAGNPIVFACMLARMQLFSEARFQFQKMKDGVPGELFNGPSTYLNLLNTPWPGGTTSMMLKEMIVDADLGGNAFRIRRPGLLARLRPDWTVIIGGSPRENANAWDPDVEILGYGYQPGGPTGSAPWEYYQRSEVAHFKPVPDPTKRFSGMSWMIPVMREIMGDSASTSHKLNYFEHAATPNLMVQFDATMSKAQALQWRDEFAREHAGPQNASKTLFLGGGSSAQVVGANLQQVDFVKVQAGGELRIASAAGVPPIIVGLSGGLDAATYSNYGQARRAFADLTQRPLWRDVCGALQTITSVPENSRLWVDLDHISFLQEDVKDNAEIQQTQANAMRTLIDAGYEAETVVKSITNNNWSLLKHSGLFSVQLQPAGTAPKAEPDVQALPVAPADASKAARSASPITGEVRCSSCDKLLAEMATAPYRFGCPRCKSVTTSGLTAEPLAA